MAKANKKRKLTQKQIAAGFGGKRRKAASKSTRKRTATKKRAPARKRTTTKRRRTTTARRKTKRKAPKPRVKVLTRLAAWVAAAEVVSEMLNAGILDAAKAKDARQFVAAFLAGGKASLDFESLVKILGPTTAIGVWNFLRAQFRIKAPALGKNYSLA